MAAILSFLASKWTILVAILFFGVIVMVHELGHFTFAKLFKVKVNEFAMGMGPKLFSKVKGDTRYSVRLFPIGGFVSMEGEDEESEDERAFNKKPCWQRIVIVVAGALVNVLLGLIIVAVSLSISDGLAGTNYVHSFVVDSKQVAEYEGLKSNDKIVKIDGRTVLYYTDVAYLLSRTNGVTDIVVERNGEKIELTDVSMSPYQLVILGTDKTAGTVFRDTFKQSVSICRMVWLSLFDMVTGKYSIKDVSGPVGVVDFVSDATQESVKTSDYSGLLTMMALITINIGLFNLLPLPALDGGRLLFLVIELIRRKPVNQKYESLVHGIGMVLLLLFMVAITFKDIYTLIVN